MNIMTVILIALAAPIALYIAWDSLGMILSNLARYRQKSEKTIPGTPLSRVAILYLTSDDFDPEACAAILSQSDLPFDFFILDDSTKTEERDRIDKWVAQQTKPIVIVRREVQQGFKAGNINNWLRAYGDPSRYPYFLLVDSDENIPQTFTRDILRRIVHTNSAFVQGVHTSTEAGETFFQRSMNLQVMMYHRFQLPSWNYKGFVPSVGHGVIFNTGHIHSAGGFPEVISEDIALSIVLAGRGLQGLIAPDIVAQESFPKSYRSYWSRRYRHVQADTQLIRKFILTIWKTSMRLIGKISLSIRELRFPVMTTYWMLCVSMAVGGIAGLTASPLSPWWWLILPVLFFPSWPALTFSTYSLMRRVWYLICMPVVGIAGIGVTPLAVMTASRERLTFISTGSRAVQSRPLDTRLWWEVVSGALFMVGGFAGSNWILFVVGLVIFTSPLLRTKLEVPVLITLVAVFWTVTLAVILSDFAAGQASIEHFLLLLPVGLVLI